MFGVFICLAFGVLRLVVVLGAWCLLCGSSCLLLCVTCDLCLSVVLNFVLVDV